MTDSEGYKLCLLKMFITFGCHSYLFIQEFMKCSMPLTEEKKIWCQLFITLLFYLSNSKLSSTVNWLSL